MKEKDEWSCKHYGTKRCYIYRIGDKYKISGVAYDKESGMAFLNDPVYTLEITESSCKIGSSIIEALNQTKTIELSCNFDATSREWLYKNFTLRSYGTLDRKYSCCHITLFEDILEIKLMKYNPEIKGPDIVAGKEKSLQYSITTDFEIGDVTTSFLIE